MMPSLTNNNYSNTTDACRIPKFGCSAFSSYIPLFALYAVSESVFFSKEGVPTIIWHHRIPRYSNYETRYDALFNRYRTAVIPTLWKNSQNEYYIRKGMICDMNHNILFAIAVESQSWTSLDRVSPDYEKMIAIVSKNFQNPEHRLLYNRCKKDIFETLPVDMLTTGNPDKYLFQVPNFIPTFDTIDGMLEHSETINELLCLRKKVPLQEVENLQEV